MKTNQGQASLGEESIPFIASGKVSQIRKKILSKDLTLDANWVLHLKRFDAREDDRNQYSHFDLREVILPPNGLFSYGQPLVARADLVEALILALDHRINKTISSKSRTSDMQSTFRDLIYFIEYLWRKDVIHLNSALPIHVIDLPRQLSQGWPIALGLYDMVRKADRVLLRDMLLAARRPLDSSEDLLKSYFHTNCVMFVTRGANRRFALGESDVLPEPKKLSASAIMTSLYAINLFAEIASNYGLQFFPFHHPKTISKLYGKPAGRTENLDLEVAVKLLTKAYEWIYEVSHYVVELLHLLIDESVRNRKLGRKVQGKDHAKIIREYVHLEKIEAACGLKLTTSDSRQRDHNGSFRQVLITLMTACFVIVTIMNARRDGEISHKKFGIMADDLVVLDEDLELYETKFYLEKTELGRQPFYINSVTKDAIRILEAIEIEFSYLDMLTKGRSFMPAQMRSLFGYRRFSYWHGTGRAKKWWTFGLRKKESDALLFVQLALGTTDIKISSHMFRRFYGLVFFNRYENADIMALSDQYGHMSLSTTLIYLSDPASRPEYQTIPFAIGNLEKKRTQEFAARQNDVMKDLVKVGYEKMRSDIHGALNKGAYCGGYAKLLNRLRDKFSAVLKFRDASAEDQSQFIFETVKRRGHFPRPKVDGICMIGTAGNVSRANCYSKETGYLHKEDANPARCGGCLFHLSGASYLRSLDSLAKNKADDLAHFPKESVLYKTKLSELSNLTGAIELIKKRTVDATP